MIDKCIQDGIYIDIASLVSLAIFSDTDKDILRKTYDDQITEKRKSQFVIEATKFMLGEGSVGKVINAVNNVNEPPFKQPSLNEILKTSGDSYERLRNNALKAPLLGMEMSQLEQRLTYDAQMENYAKRWAR